MAEPELESIELIEPKAERKSDILERLGEKGLVFGISGIVAIAFAGLLFRYRGDGYLLGLAWVLILAGVGGVLFALYQTTQVKKVTSVDIECVYCHDNNEFTSFPEDDFRCGGCNRLIPVLDGKILEVQQVRCGYCNTLNYYSEKNEVLICEECDHEIPLATTDGTVKHVMRAYAVTDDDRLYELVLTGSGHKNEDLINALQHILALNRNQVKLMLTELPVTILTGISRKKAEILQAQLSIHEGSSEMHALN